MPNVSQGAAQLIGLLRSLFAVFLITAMCLEAYSISDTIWCDDQLSVSDCVSQGVMISVIIALIFQGIAFLFIFFTFCNHLTQTCLWMHRASVVPMFSFGVVLGSCIISGVYIGNKSNFPGLGFWLLVGSLPFTILSCLSAFFTAKLIQDKYLPSDWRSRLDPCTFLVEY